MRRQKGVCFVFIPFFVTSNGVVWTFITITYELGKFIKCLGIVWWLSFKDIGVLHFTSFHDEKIVASRWDNYSVGHRCPHNKPFIITKLEDVRFVERTGQRLGVNLYQAQCLIESDVLFRGQRDIRFVTRIEVRYISSKPAWEEMVILWAISFSMVIADRQTLGSGNAFIMYATAPIYTVAVLSRAWKLTKQWR